MSVARDIWLNKFRSELVRKLSSNEESRKNKLGIISKKSIL